MRRFLVLFIVLAALAYPANTNATHTMLNIQLKLYARFTPYSGTVVIKNARVEVYQKVLNGVDRFLTAGYISSSGSYSGQVTPFEYSNGVDLYFKIYTTDDISVNVLRDKVDSSSTYFVKSQTYEDITTTSISKMY